MEKFLNLEGLEYVCGRMRSDLSGKQDVLTGQPGQVVGFDEVGAALARNGWGNPNLLDNWYFVAPINQRGQTEYIENGYTIDRWCLFSSIAEISIENGIVVHQGAQGYFQQRFDRFRMKNLVGQVVTLSTLVDGQLYTASGILKNTGNSCMIDSVPIGSLSIFYDNYKCEVNFQFSGAAGTLQAAKLELGPIQTLAHREGETWVLNDPPPDPALELAKCQRYYYNSMYNGINTRNLHVFRLETSSNVPVVNVKFPVPMRRNPTVTIISGDGSTQNAVSSWASNTPVADITVTRRLTNTGTLGMGTLSTTPALPAGTYSFHIIADANL